ncbi:MAG: hypothetical protein JNM17_20930 [Archangium sp.]|nr:hypothetical protein [Archangium sp.]
MSETTAQELSPKDWMEKANHAMVDFQRSYGCLVSRTKSGEYVAKATGFLARIGSRNVLVTALHVIQSQEFQAGQVHLLLPPAGITVDGTKYEFYSAAIDVGTPLWTSEALDIAILDVPPLPEKADAKFIDSASHEVCATKLRTSKHKHEMGLLAFGFPNWGHVTTGPNHALAALPLPAFVARLDKDAWEEGVTPPPQLVLQVEAKNEAEVPKGAQELATQFRKMLDAQTVQASAPGSKVSPFGGYSGGPVALLCPDGLFIVGVITDGGPILEGAAHRMWASPWDDVCASLRQSAPWAIESPEIPCTD